MAKKYHSVTGKFIGMDSEGESGFAAELEASLDHLHDVIAGGGSGPGTKHRRETPTNSGDTFILANPYTEIDLVVDTDLNTYPLITYSDAASGQFTLTYGDASPVPGSVASKLRVDYIEGT